MSHMSLGFFCIFHLFFFSPSDSIWIFSADLSSTLHVLSSVVSNLHNIVWGLSWNVLNYLFHLL